MDYRQGALVDLLLGTGICSTADLDSTAISEGDGELDT